LNTLILEGPAAAHGPRDENAEDGGGTEGSRRGLSEATYNGGEAAEAKYGGQRMSVVGGLVEAAGMGLAMRMRRTEAGPSGSRRGLSEATYNGGEAAEAKYGGQRMSVVGGLVEAAGLGLAMRMRRTEAGPSGSRRGLGEATYNGGEAAEAKYGGQRMSVVGGLVEAAGLGLAMRMRRTEAGPSGSRRGLGEATYNGGEAAEAKYGGQRMSVVGGLVEAAGMGLAMRMRRTEAGPSGPRRGPREATYNGGEAAEAKYGGQRMPVVGGLDEAAGMGLAMRMRRTEAGPRGPVAASARPPTTEARPLRPSMEVNVCPL